MNVKPGIYYADESFEELELDEGTNALPVFKQLQNIIKGHIERVCDIVDSKYIMYVDEEGLYKPHLQKNKRFPQILGTVIVMINEDYDEEEC